MTAWVDRYRRTAEERFSRLDALLAEQAATPAPDRPTSDGTTGTEGAPS